MSACDRAARRTLPTLPSPIAALALAESVVSGLVARHAYAEALPAAVPLTLTFIFLVPMAAGYRGVASSDRARIGVLTPWTALLMGMAAGVAAGATGLLCVVLLMPVLMLMALIGGALACGVHAVRRAAVRLPHLWARAASSPRRGPREALDPPAAVAYPRADVDRPGVQGGEVWKEIILRTPR